MAARPRARRLDAPGRPPARGRAAALGARRPRARARDRAAGAARSARAGMPVDVEAQHRRRAAAGRRSRRRSTASSRRRSRTSPSTPRRARLSITLTRKNGAVGRDRRGRRQGLRPGRGEPDGLGLVGMRERLALVGGTLRIEAAPGAGTTIVAEVPVELSDSRARRGRPRRRAQRACAACSTPRRTSRRSARRRSADRAIFEAMEHKPDVVLMDVDDARAERRSRRCPRCCRPFPTRGC